VVIVTVVKFKKPFYNSLIF